MNLDDIDILLLTSLQKDGRMKRSDLAKITDLSVPSVSERLKKLEEQGVISGYHAVLNPKKIHWDVTAFITVTVDNSNHYPQFLQHAKEEAQVLECHSITGEGSHMLKVRAKNTEHLELLLAKIQSWEGVASTRTRVVMSSAKEGTHIPL
ncbi:MAG: AsnC family transcriptional regulator [Deltaproteobacteria bacterium CG_4_10_14_0_2_um_filter_43_8]|nr:MAG: AsnC family transcriptional regulator [Deltaproteobacteria bacterium CG11_big_fil_rev_8_21_14_0_20_42_23]PJA19430.1 MAG: AsnC family transcriptional regulator [Deltaproteobacteria bacterium CG_4_10_14_0_2_um_filter_43_8]PJC64108.1 MAG: AsnC family transcriptional regulator [Deltaproteobacteria bacterium CG_4_9_14_0_2_um_filter_42_21]